MAKIARRNSVLNNLLLSVYIMRQQNPLLDYASVEFSFGVEGKIGVLDQFAG